MSIKEASLQAEHDAQRCFISRLHQNTRNGPSLKLTGGVKPHRWAATPSAEAGRAGIKLPRDVGSRTVVPRSQRLCDVCHVGQPVDKRHLVFECQGLESTRRNYPGLFGQRASTMIQFMRQADLHGVAKFVTKCLGVYHSTDPDGGQASDQPQVAGGDVMFLSLSSPQVSTTPEKEDIAFTLIWCAH